MLIVEKLKQLVASERKITAEIIEHIQKIDQQKIYLQMGFANLYSFLTEYIGYSAASAQRRIEAARLLTSVPEVKESVKSGKLNLSQVALVAQSIRQKIKESPEVTFNPSDKKALLERVKGLSLENSKKIINQTLDLEVKNFEKQTIQSNESVRLELTLTKDQSEMLKKVKSLMSHVNPNASVAEVFEYLAKDYLKRKDPEFMKAHSEAGLASALPTTSVAEVDSRQNHKYLKLLIPNNRNKKRKTISAKIKRLVWKRDQGQCQHFNSTTGKLCGSNHLLEYDHIKRFSHGGDESAQNLRLLCKAHNLWRS
jgi:hypothetical protein